MDNEDRSLWLILAGITLFSLWYTLTQRTNNALWLVLAAVCALLLGLRLYGAFTAVRASSLADTDIPQGEGRLPTERWVLFGYQFASIAGVGILVGPVLAAQFGYLPGYVWILVGAVLAGAVQDLVVLAASARRQGAFLPILIAEELGPWSGLAAWGIVLIALPLFLAATGSLLADLLVGNLWALYTVTVTVIVAVLAAAYESWLRPGHTGEATALGIGLGGLAMLVGARMAMQPVTTGPLASRGVIIGLLALYCFVSAVLPARALGRSRGAISGYLILAAVIALAAGIAFAAPPLRQPAVSQYASGGGPLLPGGVTPYLFIIVTSGAISGFHSLFSTGVTSRLLQRESDALPVGFGSMLVQGLMVGVLLISVCTLYRWDYIAFTTQLPLGEVERTAGNGQRDWDNLRSLLQTDKAVVPGGPTNDANQNNVRSTEGTTTIAASTTWVFKDVPGFNRQWLPTLYRFVFVLQALILLAAVEAAARACRVAVEETSKVALRIPPLARLAQRKHALAAIVAAGTLVYTLLWAGLAAKTEVMTVFYFFGFVAMLLAAVGLGAALVASWQTARWKSLVIVAPLAFMIALAVIAGFANMRDAAHTISRQNAIAQAYADMSKWGLSLKFLNPDRAREIVRQWPPAEVGKLYSEKGQAEFARQLQGRVGLSDEDGKKLASIITSRATGLSLWSWLEIVLTLFLLLLGLVVAIGRFVRVPLQWPARPSPGAGAAAAIIAREQQRAIPEYPDESGDFTI